MPKTLSRGLSQLPASTKTEGSSRLSSTETARQWLVKFAAVTGKAADPVLFGIWSEQLSDIPPDRLNAACDRLMKTWRYQNLPMPGDVRAQLDGADQKGFELEATSAWQDLLAWIDRYYHPDIGVSHGAPELPGPVEHACRAAGGFRWIERCGEDDLVWARKTFIAAYTNVHQTGEIEHLLSRGEARRVLFQITAPPGKQLGSGKPALGVSEPEGKLPPLEKVREVLCRVADLTSPPKPEAQPRGAVAAAMPVARDVRRNVAQLEKELPELDAATPPTEQELQRLRVLQGQAEMLKRTRPELWGKPTGAEKTPVSASPQPVDSASPDLAENATAERTNFAAEEVRHEAEREANPRAAAPA